MSGDVNQLEPVNDRVKKCDYNNSSALHELADGNRIQLTECRRADDTLVYMIKPQNILDLNFLNDTLYLPINDVLRSTRK